MLYKVKEVADLVGISVRTLHHYDQIGLLKPKSVASTGYRLYADHDLERLQQVLFFKELGFSLHDIKSILDSPGFDRKQALKSQKQLLIEKKKRLEAIINLVQQTIDTIEGGSTMPNTEMFKSFDMTEIEKHQKQYADEVKQKYGNTDAYKESQRKTTNYTKENWAAIYEKSNEIYNNIAALMDRSPEDPKVQEEIGKWRQHISDNFYNCTLEIFRGLGDLYVQDQRFTANIDKVKPGLAKFMKEGIHFYCNNQEE